ncbi:MAG: hypothetical protein H3C48_16025 [Chitinophagaceae bacterium]|nr:hypothetical protein [Chitinophagaceae bacterium]
MYKRYIVKPIIEALKDTPVILYSGHRTLSGFGTNLPAVPISSLWGE